MEKSSKGKRVLSTLVTIVITAVVTLLFASFVDISEIGMNIVAKFIPSAYAYNDNVRFQVSRVSTSNGNGVEIWVDTIHGVNYLFMNWNVPLTKLYDSNGNLLVTPIE